MKDIKTSVYIQDILSNNQTTNKEKEIERHKDTRQQKENIESTIEKQKESPKEAQTERKTTSILNA